MGGVCSAAWAAPPCSVLVLALPGPPGSAWDGFTTLRCVGCEVSGHCGAPHQAAENRYLSVLLPVWGCLHGSPTLHSTEHWENRPYLRGGKASLALVARRVHGEAKTTVLNTGTQDKLVSLTSFMEAATPAHTERCLLREEGIANQQKEEKIPCSACGVCEVEQWGCFQVYKFRQSTNAGKVMTDQPDGASARMAELDLLSGTH